MVAYSNKKTAQSAHTDPDGHQHTEIFPRKPASHPSRQITLLNLYNIEYFRGKGKINADTPQF